MRDCEDRGRSVEIALSANDEAPGAARTAVRRWLTGRALSAVVDNVRLVVSELVTNSVRHGGAGAGAPVLTRIRLASGTLRVEVEDRGRGGVVALRPGNLDVGGGFGLHLVEAVSQSWGVERTPTGGTRVWAVLESPTIAAEPHRPGDAENRLAPVVRATEARPPEREVHVVPDERGATWRVFDGNAERPRSEHTNATHAELAALACAEDAGAERVVIHDRYQRVRDAMAPRRGLGERVERVRDAARAVGARPR
jgi:anti-sigma regulatory factor (Ser/Thr protein kinase)